MTVSSITRARCSQDLTGDPVRDAGALYRLARTGVKPVAEIADVRAADDLRRQCDRIGLSDVSFVPRQGRKSTQPRATAAAIRVAIAGYGVVGQALAERLAVEPGFEIVAILVRDPARPRRIAPPVPLIADRAAFLAVPADVIVDALSCDATGALLCGAALPAGVHIVSASKRVVSAAHSALSKSARDAGVELLYSAAVGGSAPVLETIARAPAPVVGVTGIVNGTVNFILDRLADGERFDAALVAARVAGFAEEDSSADLSGADAAAKARLIALAAFGTDPASVAVTAEPLDDAAATQIAASGERWVQVAEVTRSAASVRLLPARVAGLPAPLAEGNAARVTLADGRILACAGRGAGGAPTAEAIVADLFDIADCIAAANPAQHALAC